MIKAQEAIRKIDKLGRIRITSEFARRLKLKEGSKCEITIEYGRICIKKFDSNNVMDRPYTGMVRKLDSLLRLCLPKEYIEVLKIPKDSKLTLLLEKNRIVIQK